MRKGQTVYCSGHLNVGEQDVDATEATFQNNQGRLGMFGFHDLKALVIQRLNNN